MRIIKQLMKNRLLVVVIAVAIVLVSLGAYFSLQWVFVVDAKNESSSTGYYRYNTGIPTNSRMCAQSFIPISQTYNNIGKIGVNVATSGNFYNSFIYFRLYKSNTAGGPPVTQLYSQYTLASALPSNGWFELDGPLQWSYSSADAPYLILVVDMTQVSFGSGAYIDIRYSGNTYSSGAMWHKNDAGTWTVDSFDMLFRTYQVYYQDVPPSCSSVVGPGGCTSCNTEVGTNYGAFTVSGSDPDGDSLEYYVRWGDGSNSGWSSTSNNFYHTWGNSGDYSVDAKVRANGVESGWCTSIAVHVTGGTQNQPPSIPATPTGDTSLVTGQTGYYATAGSTDPEGDSIVYQFAFGDGASSDWVSDPTWVPHAYSNDGTFYVKVQAMDSFEHTSGWSNTLGVTVTSGEPPEEIIFRWKNTISECQTSSWQQPIAADVLSQYPGKEIFVAGTTGPASTMERIACLRQDTGEVIWHKEWIPVETAQRVPMSIAKINGEWLILHGNRDSTVCRYASNGNIKWENTDVHSYWEWNAWVDVNTDPNVEDYYAFITQRYSNNYENGNQYIYKLSPSDGHIVASHFVGKGVCDGGIAAADINADGKVEIVEGDQRVRCWDSDLNPLWDVVASSSSACPNLVDINNDGLLEVICINGYFDGGGIIVIAPNGNIIANGAGVFNNIPGWATHETLTVVDADADGRMEVLTAYGSSWVMALDLVNWINDVDHPGQYIDWSSEVLGDGKGWASNSPAFGNVVGDSRLEMLYQESWDCKLHAFDSTWTEIATAKNCWGSLTVDDFDGDGLNEIVAAQCSEVHPEFVWNVQMYDTPAVTLNGEVTEQYYGLRRTYVNTYYTPEGSRPTASFTSSYYLGKYTFDGSASTGFEPLMYRWDWNNDGVWERSWTTSPIVTDIYGLPDSCQVTLEVKDASNVHHKVTQAVSSLALITITSSPSSLKVSASAQSLSSKAQYFAWDWNNDGKADTAFSTKTTASYTYRSAGTYTIRLIVGTKTGAVLGYTTKVVSLGGQTSAPEIPGFEVIPLLVSLFVAILLYRRRNK